MSLFREVFNKQSNNHQQNSLQDGELFPLEIQHGRGEVHVIIVLSLHCSTCVDYLQEIDQIEMDSSTSLTFLINGEIEEVQYLSDQMSDKYSFNSITDHDMIQKYKVFTNPFVYILDHDNLVRFSKKIENVHETNELIKEYYLLRNQI